MRNILKLGASIGLCILAGLLGIPFNLAALRDWYPNLEKPWFTPPSYLFEPVWTILYILMGVSFYLVWKRGTKTVNAKQAIKTFGIQLFLNTLWSPIFFGLKNPLLGLVVIITMLSYIVKTIRAFAKINPLASYLLYPYLIWVSFATLLNFSIWLLNR